MLSACHWLFEICPSETQKAMTLRVTWQAEGREELYSTSYQSASFFVASLLIGCCCCLDIVCHPGVSMLCLWQCVTQIWFVRPLCTSLSWLRWLA